MAKKLVPGFRTYKSIQYRTLVSHTAQRTSSSGVSALKGRPVLVYQLEKGD
jgi:hypothetical protein